MTTATLPTAPVEAPAYDDRLGDVGDDVMEALLDAAALLEEVGEEEGARPWRLYPVPHSTSIATATNMGAR